METCSSPEKGGAGPAIRREGNVYITNRKTSGLKEGDRFHSGDVVAKNENFFQGEGEDLTYVTGKLAKIAVAPLYSTYEDSCVVTEGLSGAMTAHITMAKSVAVGKNANVERIVGKGDRIKTGDPLMVYENSHDDKEANEMIARLGAEMGQAISEMGKNAIRSKYTGEVVDVRIYYNVEKDELSPSLRALVDAQDAAAEARLRVMSRYARGEVFHGVDVSPAVRVPGEKIKGREIDGILVEFFVRYRDKLYIGDKVTFSVALKSIIADVLQSNEAPYSEGNSSEEIGAVLSPFSVVNRMTTDVFSQMYLNKVLIELKRKFIETLGL